MDAAKITRRSFLAFSAATAIAAFGFGTNRRAFLLEEERALLGSLLLI